jgi:hypothetical protein
MKKNNKKHNLLYRTRKRYKGIQIDTKDRTIYLSPAEIAEGIASAKPIIRLCEEFHFNIQLEIFNYS